MLVGTAEGEAALFESNVICEYIEDTQDGAKLHPRDALERAQHRAWMEFVSTILGELWGLVDAVFAPIFRYFDLFDHLTDLSVFADKPKVRAWRKVLAQRPSVRTAVRPDYPPLLHAFLVRHDAHMLKLAA